MTFAEAVQALVGGETVYRISWEHSGRLSLYADYLYMYFDEGWANLERPDLSREDLTATDWKVTE